MLACLLIVLLAAGFFGYQWVLGRIGRAAVVEKEVDMNEELLQMMNASASEPTQETTVPVTTEAATEAATLPTGPLEPDALNILVVGQAAREGEEYRMADTMMLVTVNKNTKVVTLTSIQRDTYVDLPDYMGHPCGWNRINLCYHLGWTFGDTGGAMEMTNLCLKNNFGMEVDYDVEIDFTAFAKIVDALGGVRLPLTEAEREYLAKEGFPELSPGEQEGEYRLFGYEALAYARMRKAKGDSDSDIKRTARQRALVEAILQKLQRKGISAAKDLINEVLPLLTTNMTNAQITECLTELLPMLPEITIEKGTCPVEGSSWGQIIDLYGTPSSVLKFDAGTNKKYFSALTQGLPVA